MMVIQNAYSERFCLVIWITFSHDQGSWVFVMLECRASILLLFKA